MSDEELEAQFEDETPEPETPEPEAEEREEEGEQGEGEGGEDDKDWRPEFDDRTQKFIDERIVAPKVARTREMEQQLQQYQRQLEELQSRLPEDAPPAVPEMPDPWDEDYEQKLADRDAALLSRARWDDEQQAAKDREEHAQYQNQREAQEHTAKQQAGFMKRAEKAGIKREDLSLSAGAVGNGVSANVANYIIEHESGPQITMYLSERPDELEDLRQMSSVRAAVYIETKVLPKATKRRNPPPPPARGVKGSGPGAEDGALKGAKFG